MIWLYLLGYAVIAGVIFMDRGSEIEYVQRMIKKRLKPFGIGVDITLHDDETVTLSAKKQIGLTVKHANIQSNSLVEAIIKLIAYIEKNFQEWVEELTYGK